MRRSLQDRGSNGSPEPRSGGRGEAIAEPLRTPTRYSADDAAGVAVDPDLRARLSGAVVQCRSAITAWHRREQEGAAPETDPGKQPALTSSSSGQRLPEPVQTKMERAFATDFSQVRVHQGPEPAAIGAQAYTRGTDIHFAPGQYDPASLRGQELLGHELAHVQQQARGVVKPTVQAKGMPLNEEPALEREADAMGARAARGVSVGAAARADVGASASGRPGGDAVQRHAGGPGSAARGAAPRAPGTAGGRRKSTRRKPYMATAGGKNRTILTPRGKKWNGKTLYFFYGYKDTGNDPRYREKEAAALDDDVERAAAMGFEVVYDLKGTSEDFMAALGDPNCYGIYWGSHGSSSGLIQGSDGKFFGVRQVEEAVSKGALKVSGKIQYLVLAACFSATQRKRWEKLLPGCQFEGWIPSAYPSDGVDFTSRTERDEERPHGATNPDKELDDYIQDAYEAK